MHVVCSFNGKAGIGAGEPARGGDRGTDPAGRRRTRVVGYPSMRETPVGADAALREFGERLFGGGFDMMILMTGVGARHLNKALEEAFPEKRPLAECAAYAHGGGARSEAGCGAPRDGPGSYDHGARAEHVARGFEGDGGTRGAADRGPGVWAFE